MMTIMVCTFKQNEELPTNQSEIYERLVTLVISRYLQKFDDKLPKSKFIYQRHIRHIYNNFQNLHLKQLKVMQLYVFGNEDIEKFS